jgi:hypothetical protein
MFELQHKQMQLNMLLAATETLCQLRGRIYNLTVCLGAVCVTWCVPSSVSGEKNGYWKKYKIVACLACPASL